jgi:hypothetical protein
MHTTVEKYHDDAAAKLGSNRRKMQALRGAVARYERWDKLPENRKG